MGLSDEDFAELESSNTTRLAELSAQGVAFGGIAEDYQLRLLEGLCGPGLVRRCKEEHQLWIRENIEANEAMIQEHLTRQKLGLGPEVPNGNRAQRRHPTP